MFKKYGLIQQIEETSTIPEIVIEKKSDPDHWFDDYIAKRFDEAIKKLDIEISNQTEIKAILNYKIAKLQCLYKKDDKNISLFEELLLEHPDQVDAYMMVARSLSWENYFEKAINIAIVGVGKFGLTNELIEVLTYCHLKNGDRELAIECFNNDVTFNSPETAIKFAEIYIEDKNYTAARDIIHKVYLRYPNNKFIWGKYAKVATDLNLPKIALFFYDKLSNNDIGNISHHGYIGNVCLQLNLNDISLSQYQKANEMANESQEWLLSNIGNLLKNKGFYSEAIKYLKKGIEQNDTSDYAHDRLSGALKLKEEEGKEYQKHIKEAQIELKQFTPNLSLTTEGISSI